MSINDLFVDFQGNTIVGPDRLAAIVRLERYYLLIMQPFFLILMRPPKVLAKTYAIPPFGE
jgi:hypothetical protein